MTIWVFRNGELVEKGTVGPRDFAKSANLASPRISRFAPMESPVTGKEISSWRERDRDMQAVDAIDRRDLPKDYKPSKGREAQFDDARRSRPDPEWGGLD